MDLDSKPPVLASTKSSGMNCFLIPGSLTSTLVLLSEVVLADLDLCNIDCSVMGSYQSDATPEQSVLEG